LFWLPFLARSSLLGVTYAFGVFLEPLSVAFGASHASTSTISRRSRFFLAAITGDLADRFGPRCC
jgi:hypothetical protein